VSTAVDAGAVCEAETVIQTLARSSSPQFRQEQRSQFTLGFFHTARALSNTQFTSKSYSKLASIQLDQISQDVAESVVFKRPLLDRKKKIRKGGMS
jgi:hypothetical protein